MQIRRWLYLAGMAAVLTTGAPRAEAATITGINQFLLPGSSTGSLAMFPAVAPNNDNAPAPSPNVIVAGAIFLNDFGILDYEFNLADSGGTTEYFFTTSLTNNTGIAWNDFHFQLGFGTGAAFVPVAPFFGLDFDTPDGDPVPTSSAFPVLNHQPIFLDWSGATVNSPFSVAFTLSIDIPDGLSAFHPQGANRFTLRSFPTTQPAQQVPEPATAALAGAGLAYAAMRRRRRN